MTEFDLTQFFELFIEGAVIGIIIAFIPFVIAFAIQSLYSIMKKA